MGTTRKQDEELCAVIANSRFEFSLRGDVSEIVEWVAENIDIEELFSTSQLENWATRHGWVKGD